MLLLPPCCKTSKADSLQSKWRFLDACSSTGDQIILLSVSYFVIWEGFAYNVHVNHPIQVARSKGGMEL